ELRIRKSAVLRQTNKLVRKLDRGREEREVRGVFTRRNLPYFLMLATDAPRNGLVPRGRRIVAESSRGEPRLD
ncbi:hypothetical protein M9458_030164, partial [Cirrhinus mrigala]